MSSAPRQLLCSNIVIVFSKQLLDHFHAPRNAGPLPEATATVEASNPVCGDILHLAARMENGRIAEVRFLCRGCATAIACASLLTEKLKTRTPLEARAITSESISQELGGLPPASLHGAQLAVDALSALLAQLPVKN